MKKQHHECGIIMVNELRDPIAISRFADSSATARLARKDYSDRDWPTKSAWRARDAGRAGSPEAWDRRRRRREVFSTERRKAARAAVPGTNL